MTVPNFFLIGAPKCGTSSMCDYLSQHPEIFIPSRKEPHYFCSDFHIEADTYHEKINHRHYGFDIRTEARWLDLFVGCGEKKCVGDGSTSYLYSQEAARNIHSFNPAAKIICIVRDPVEVAYSWYTDLLFSSEEIAESFEDALALEESRLRGESLHFGVKHPARLFISPIS